MPGFNNEVFLRLKSLLQRVKAKIKLIEVLTRRKSILSTEEYIKRYNSTNSELVNNKVYSNNKKNTPEKIESNSSANKKFSVTRTLTKMVGPLENTPKKLKLRTDLHKVPNSQDETKTLYGNNSFTAGSDDNVDKTDPTNWSSLLSEASKHFQAVSSGSSKVCTMDSSPNSTVSESDTSKLVKFRPRILSKHSSTTISKSESSQIFKPGTSDSLTNVTGTQSPVTITFVPAIAIVPSKNKSPSSKLFKFKTPVLANAISPHASENRGPVGAYDKVSHNQSVSQSNEFRVSEVSSPQANSASKSSEFVPKLNSGFRNILPKTSDCQTGPSSSNSLSVGPKLNTGMNISSSEYVLENENEAISDTHPIESVIVKQEDPDSWDNSFNYILGTSSYTGKYFLYCIQ